MVNFQGRAVKLPVGYYINALPIWKKNLVNQFICRFWFPSHLKVLVWVLSSWLSFFAEPGAEKNMSNASSDTVDGSEIRLTSWYAKYPTIYRVSHMLGGAGFCPSTVPLETSCFGTQSHGGGWSPMIFLFQKTGEFKKKQHTTQNSKEFYPNHQLFQFQWKKNLLFMWGWTTILPHSCSKLATRRHGP